MNQNAKYLFTFNYRQVRAFTFEFNADNDNKNLQLGDVQGDELTAADDTYLRHEFIFFSGTRIVIEAREVSFNRRGFYQ